MPFFHIAPHSLAPLMTSAPYYNKHTTIKFINNIYTDLKQLTQCYQYAARVADQLDSMSSLDPEALAALCIR